MKLVFWCDSGNIELFNQIAKKLEKDKWENIFLMLDKYDERRLRSIRTNAHCYNLTNYMHNNWSAFTSDKLTYYQNKYPNINFWEIYYSDRHIAKYDRDDSIKFLIGHIMFLEMLYETERPDAFVYETPDNITAYLAVELGRYFNVTYVGFIGDSLNYNTKMQISDNVFFINEKMKKLYYGDYQFTQEEIKNAQTLIERISDPHNRPAYMEAHTKAPKFKWSFISDIAKYIIRRFLPRFNDKYCYINYKNYKQHLQPIKRFLSYKKCKKYFLKPIEKQKYYVFPLHYQPEVTTSIWASKYVNQLFFIDNIAKSIPLDTVLYVKEHYGGLGSRQERFYKDLKKYKNVRLIDPFINIHTLIDNAQATLVLTNTTGLECIIRQKPVIVCGSVYYDFFEGVTKVNDIYCERSKILKPNLVEKDKVIRFVASYQKSFYNGYINPADIASLEEKNIDNFVYAIKDFLKQNKSKGNC